MVVERERGRQKREVTYMTPTRLICSCFTAFIEAHTQIHSLPLLSVNDGATKSSRQQKRNGATNNNQGVHQMPSSVRASFASLYLLPVVENGLRLMKNEAASSSRRGFTVLVFFCFVPNSVPCTKKLSALNWVPLPTTSFRLVYFSLFTYTHGLEHVFRPCR